MKLKVKETLHNNVLIKILEQENQQMRGNIFIPDNGSDKSSKIGQIISIGPGSWTLLGERIPTEREVGEIVAIPNFGGQNFKLNGEEFVIIKETDILLTLEEEKL